MDTLTAVLAIGLVVRLTRLLTKDRAFYWWRLFATVRLPGPIGYLSRCGWCTSVWVAAGVAALAYFYGDSLTFQVVAFAGSASLVAGWHSTWLDPDTDQETVA